MTTTDLIAPEAQDLEAYRSTTAQAPHTVTHLRMEQRDRIAFAKDDPDLILGLAVCKVGVFNGTFEVTRDDLDAWVTRFYELRGTLRPPMRIDHSFSVLGVIGRFENLRVEDRPDEALGGVVVPMLVGDFRLVGTKADRRLNRERIEGDQLNERSSEFWSYETNTGARYPSIFAGCAFVDIPAVEGLGNVLDARGQGEVVTLRRGPATLSATTPEEGTSMTDDTTPDEVETPPTGDEVTPGDAPVEDATTPTTEDEDAPIVIGDADEDEGDPAGDPDVEQQPTGEQLSADVIESLRAAGIAPTILANLERDVEARVALRVEANERYRTQELRGVIPLKLKDGARALLEHHDKNVRDTFAAFLEAARPPVKLRAAVGTLGARSSGAPAGDRTTHLVHLDMTREEAAEAYANASAEDRRKFRHEMAAWQADHPVGE